MSNAAALVGAGMMVGYCQLFCTIGTMTTTAAVLAALAAAVLAAAVDLAVAAAASAAAARQEAGRGHYDYIYEPS